MGKGRLLIVVENGNVATSNEMINVNSLDITQVIAQLELVKRELINAYEKMCKTGKSG